MRAAALPGRRSALRVRRSNCDYDDEEHNDAQHDKKGNQAAAPLLLRLRLLTVRRISGAQISAGWLIGLGGRGLRNARLCLRRVPVSVRRFPVARTWWNVTCGHNS